MIYNWNIIGHEKQLKQLEKDITTNNIAHAYLLSGPEHVGKFTVAKKLASILQCENNFCGVCPTCLQIRKGSHLDTMEFKNDHEILSIETVRDILFRCNLSSQSKYKIVLIQGIERMLEQTANTILKTLEEPPGKTVFIMTTNNIREILPTILSRTRIIPFNLFSHDFLTSMLKQKYPDVDDEKTDQASKLSLGRAGFAIDLMERPEKFADFLKLYKDITYLLQTNNIVEKFSYIEDLLSEKNPSSSGPTVRVNNFLNVMSHILRSKTLDNISEKKVDVKHLIDMITKAQNASLLLKKNVNAKLLLENLLLN